MSLVQFQESFQIGAFYSRHHYYDPGSTLIPPPPYPGNVGKLLTNTDTYFAWLMSVQRSQFNIFWGEEGELEWILPASRSLSQNFQPAL